LQHAVPTLKQDPVLDDSDTALEAVLASENESLQAVRDYELAVIAKDDEKIQECITRPYTR